MTGYKEGIMLEPPDEGSLILLDSSAVMYFLATADESPSGARRGAVENFIHVAASSGWRLAASTAIWIELLEGPLARRDREAAEACRRFLADSSRIYLREVDVVVAERAAALGASLPTARRRTYSSLDLIHIATAIELGAQAILTNDEAWASVPLCPPLILVDELAAEINR
jgi:Predicted nucleic acid-binding protein, contains PIN domain